MIKRILPALAADEIFLRLFEEETRISTLMRHPNVVRVLDAGEVDGQPFIAMEYVDGLDCWRVVNRCAVQGVPTTAEIAIFIVAQVLRGLAYVHNATDESGQLLKVVHGDVSPTNIYISREGDIKLGDFGIARSRHRALSASKSNLRGKVAYLAPEQVRGDEADYRTDLFAAGTVLAELLIQTRLFGGGSQLTTLLAIRDVRLDVLEKHRHKLPDGMEAVLRRALAKEPVERFPSALSMSRSLERFLKTSGTADLKAELARLVEQARLIRTSVAPAPPAAPPPMPRRASSAITPPPPAKRHSPAAVPPPPPPDARWKGLPSWPEDLGEIEDLSEIAGFEEFKDEAEVDGISGTVHSQMPASLLPTAPPPLHLALDAPADLLAITRSQASPLSGRVTVEAPGDFAQRLASSKPTLNAPAPVIEEETTMEAPVTLMRRMVDDEQLVQEEIEIFVDESMLGDDPSESTSEGLNRYLFRRADGTTMGPVSYGMAVEWMVTERIRSTHEVSIGGGPFRPVSLVPDLARHAPALTPATAQAPVLGPPDRRGLFEAERPWRVLYDLAQAEETGVVVFDQESVRKEVYLVGGKLQYVTSNVSGELLGETLVARGVLTEQQLQAALNVLAQYSGHLGDALVGLNLLEPLQLFRYLTEHVQDRFMEVFRWRRGEYHFYRGVENPDAAFPLHVETTRLLWDAVNRGVTEDEARAWLDQHAGWQLEIKPEAWTKLSQLGFPQTVNDALSLVREPTLLQTAMEHCPVDLSQLDLLRALRLVSDLPFAQLSPPSGQAEDLPFSHR